MDGLRKKGHIMNWWRGEEHIGTCTKPKKVCRYRDALNTVDGAEDQMKLYVSRKPEKKGGGSNSFAWNFVSWAKRNGHTIVSRIQKAERAIIIANILSTTNSLFTGYSCQHWIIRSKDSVASLFYTSHHAVLISDWILPCACYNLCSPNVKLPVRNNPRYFSCPKLLKYWL